MADNTKAAPMTYETRALPNLKRQRQRLAMTADSMPAGDLRKAAAEAQIDTSGAKTKADLADAVKSAGRTA
jgi:hypothetical protein